MRTATQLHTPSLLLSRQAGATSPLGAKLRVHACAALGVLVVGYKPHMIHK